MSINKHINHNNHDSKRRSLLQRALEYIKDTLAFRNQWMHLQKRGKTPNFLYLKSGARDRKLHDKEFSDVGNINPSGAEESIESESVLNLGALFEPPPITVVKHPVEEHTATELHLAIEGPGHDAKVDLVDPCPVALEQIVKSLQILDTADAENQLFFESVLPVVSLPNMIRGATVKPLDSCTGEIQEVTAAAYASEEGSVHRKGPAETVSSPKKSHKNRGAQVHVEDCCDQMQLPFE